MADYWDKLWKGARTRSTRVHEKEALALWQLAVENPQHLVEVGTMYGGTAWLVGHVVQRMTLIDNWVHDTKQSAMDNTKEFQTKRTVISQPDGEVFPQWIGGDISLLFLDKQPIRDDLLASLAGWRPFVTGTVAVHDADRPVVIDALADSGITILRQVERLAICSWSQKCQTN